MSAAERFAAHLNAELAAIDAAGLRKRERVIATPQGALVRTADGRELINLCSNNYLGLSSHPQVLEAAREALATLGYGMSSVRFNVETKLSPLEPDETTAPEPFARAVLDVIRTAVPFSYSYQYYHRRCGGQGLCKGKAWPKGTCRSRRRQARPSAATTTAAAARRRATGFRSARPRRSRRRRRRPAGRGRAGVPAAD
jgi:hypothetical protein